MEHNNIDRVLDTSGNTLGRDDLNKNHLFLTKMSCMLFHSIEFELQDFRVQGWYSYFMYAFQMQFYFLVLDLFMEILDDLDEIQIHV